MDEIAQGVVPTSQEQPAPKPPADLTNVPALSDEDVRRAIEGAEKLGISPEKLSVSEMASLQNENPAKADASQTRMSPDQTVNPNAVKLEVPDQFRTPDGEADVEKIKDATRQLDAEIQKKEEKIGKSVDDYLREYREKQTQFRNMPNPDKLGERLRAQAPNPPTQYSDQQLREIIMNDYRVDPIGTITNLTEAMVSRHLQPFNEEKRERALRSNVESLAKEDPRILDGRLFAAVNAELDANPKLWELDNPHEFAWLKVKERMRLGEAPRGVSAQPSRPPAPILGAGAPPSAPSSSGPRTAARGTLESLDIRDKKQEALGDEMLRKALERKTY